LNSRLTVVEAWISSFYSTELAFALSQTRFWILSKHHRKWKNCILRERCTFEGGKRWNKHALNMLKLSSFHELWRKTTKNVFFYKFLYLGKYLPYKLRCKTIELDIYTWYMIYWYLVFPSRISIFSALKFSISYLDFVLVDL
jgi:hypothetical protein